MVQTISAQATDNKQSTIINKIDSLFTLLKTAKADTTLIKLYLDIGYVYEHEKPDTSIFFYQKALNLAEKATQNLQGFKNLSGLEARLLSLQATSLNYIGIVHQNKGNYDKAIDFYFKSLKIREELGDKKGMAASYNNIGNIHQYKGDSQLDKEIQLDEYDKAIEFYFKSLKICEELGDKNIMSTCYTNIGSLYLKQNKPEEAKKQQLQALNIATEIGAKELMYSAYSSLAQCDSALGNFGGAYEYHKLYNSVEQTIKNSK